MSATTTPDIAAGWVMIDGHPVFINKTRVKSDAGRQAAREARDKAKERVKVARQAARTARDKGRARPNLPGAGGGGAPLPKAETIDQVKQRRLTEAQGNRDRLLKLVPTASVGDVSSPVVQGHLHDLSKVPEPLMKEFAFQGGRLSVDTPPVTGHPGMEKLKGEHPRGWEKKKTWSDVPGAYDPSTRTVVAGNEAPGGSRSTALHELGHAYGDTRGWDDSRELIAAHRAAYDRLPPYLQQGKPGNRAGRQEFLAESFAVAVADGFDHAARKYGPEVATFLKKKFREHGVNVE